MMTREEMIATVDGEIGRLEQIRGLLRRSHSERFVVPLQTPGLQSGGERRMLSPEARGRIVQGQKRRWAKQKGETVTASDAD